MEGNNRIQITFKKDNCIWTSSLEFKFNFKIGLNMCNGKLNKESEDTSKDDIERQLEIIIDEIERKKGNSRVDFGDLKPDPYMPCSSYSSSFVEAIMAKMAKKEKMESKPKIDEKAEIESTKISLDCKSCKVIHAQNHSKTNAELLLYQCSYCPQKEEYLGSLTEFDIKMASLNPHVGQLIENGFKYCKFCKFVCEDDIRFHEHHHRVHP